MQLDKVKMQQQIANLVKYAFKKTTDPAQDINFMSRLAHSEVFGIVKNKQLVSMIMLNRFKMQYQHHVLNMGAVGYVATYPEFRGQGLVSKLMAELFQYCIEHKLDVLSLAPFSQSFYRQYGFENTLVQKRYIFKNAAFTNLVKTGDHELILRGDWQTPAIQSAVKQVYEQALINETNVIIRPSWWWQRLDSYYPQRKIAVVYQKSQPKPTGYVIYRFLDNVLQIDELTYLTQVAKINLLQFIAKHASSFTEFHYQGALDEQLEDLFIEQNNIQISLCPYMMSRILNIAKLLQNYALFKPNVIVQVTDKFVLQNNAKFKLTQDAVQITNEPADLQASINTWTQLLLGKRTFSDLVFAKKIQVNTEKKYLRNEVIRTKTTFFDYY